MQASRDSELNALTMLSNTGSELRVRELLFLDVAVVAALVDSVAPVLVAAIFLIILLKSLSLSLHLSFLSH